MSSRMNKYYEEPENLVTRTTRNQELYKDISKSELENYSIKSNATVLGDSKPEIDIEKIKKILDTKYNETPKRKSINIEEVEEEVVEREDTKEYDINAVIEKAREEKTVDYQEERLKKIRDTQYDILKNIDVNKEKEEVSTPEDNLAELINTIALNEKQLKNASNKIEDDFDLLDLKGDDDTEVLGAMKEDIEREEEIDHNAIIDETSDVSETAEELEKSFYTTSNEILSDDFIDVNDKMSLPIKILIGLIILAFIFGIYVLVKSIFF